MKNINLAIFASGNGTNAQRIIEYFQHHEKIRVASVVYNRKQAYVAQRASSLGVPAEYFNKTDFLETDKVMAYLDEMHVDYIILAGFLLQVPSTIIAQYKGRMLNIHPSLLPKHGGAGMYGDAVHQSVLDSHDPESGITIHKVDSTLDTGEIVFQAKCPVLPDDTPHTLAERVHGLEYEYFPKVIESFVLR